MGAGFGLGVIGCGQYARYHLELLADLPQVRVVALCNPRPGQIETTLAEHPRLHGCSTYSDHRAMLDQPDLDAVLICSTHTAHADQVVDSFEGGKHVLVEKPLATSVLDVQRCIDAWKTSGKVGAVAYQRHGFGLFSFLREEIASGRFGRVLAVNAHMARPWLRLCADTWRHTRKESGGGMIGDGGSHLLDALLWSTGLQPEVVSAFMENRETEVDIDSVVNVRFRGGVLGSVTIVGDSNTWHDRYHVWTEKAAFLIEEELLRVIDDAGRETTVTKWPPNITPVSDFVHSVELGTQAQASLECALPVMELTEAAWLSASRQGMPVKVSDLQRHR